MSEQPLVRGIVVTHGSMAAGLVDAVRRISGTPADALIPISNDGRGPEELIEAVRSVVGEGPVIVFTDLQSGSCALAARLACAAPEGRRILCGVNLPMLLDFVFHRELPVDDLVERVLVRGREAIYAVKPT